MKDETQTSELPGNITFKALLGLSKLEGIEANVVRSIQAKTLKNRPLFRIVFNLLLAAIVVFLFSEGSPQWAVIGWAGAFCAFQFFSYKAFGRHWDFNRDNVDPAVFHAMDRHAAMSAIIWGSSYFFLGFNTYILQILGLWSAMLALMVYASVMMTPVPKAAT